MGKLSNPNRKKLVEETFESIKAIKFPEPFDKEQIIMALFAKEDTLKKAVYALQNFGGTGVSLILERENMDHTTVKFYNPDNDDFFEVKNIVTQTGRFSEYKEMFSLPCHLSFGLISGSNGNYQIDSVDFLKIPVLSMKFGC